MMTSSPEIQPARKRWRSMRKCESCRKLKVKCTPLERVFENGERCEQCLARDLPCGPHLRFQKPASSSPAKGPDEARDSTPLHPSTRRLIPSTFTSPDHSDISFTERHGRVAENADDGFGPTCPRPSLSGSSVQPLRGASTQRCDAVSTSNRPASNLSRINDGFESLHFKSDLIQRLRSRMQALVVAAPAISLAAYEAHDAKLKLARDYTHACAQFASLLQIQIIRTIELTDLPDELLLRRLLEYARHFSDTPASQNGHLCQYFRDEQANVPESHGLILQRLITLCDEEGRVGEADRFYDELARLSLPKLLANVLEIRQRISTVSKNTTSRASVVAQQSRSDLGPYPPHAYDHIYTHSLYTATGSAILRTNDIHSAVVDIRHPTDRLGRGELHRAIETANSGLVRHLVHSNTALIRERDVFQILPLQLAASSGDLDIFNFLLAEGAHFGDLDMFGRNPFLTACESGNNEIIESLLRAGQDANESYPLQPYNPLYAAAANGHLNSVQLLLAFGARVFESVFGQTASQIAEERGHLAVLALLRSAEAEAEPQFKTSSKRFDDNTTALNNSPAKVNLSFANVSNADLSDASRSNAIATAFPATVEIAHSPLTSEVTPHPQNSYRKSTNANSTKSASSLEKSNARNPGPRPAHMPEDGIQIVPWEPPQSPGNDMKPKFGSSPQGGDIYFPHDPSSSSSCDVPSRSNGRNDESMSDLPEMMNFFNPPVGFDDLSEGLDATSHDAGHHFYPTLDLDHPGARS